MTDGRYFETVAANALNLCGIFIRVAHQGRTGAPVALAHAHTTFERATELAGSLPDAARATLSPRFVAMAKSIEELDQKLNSRA